MNLIFIISLILLFFLFLMFNNRRNKSKKMKEICARWGSIPEEPFDLETAEIFLKLKGPDQSGNCYFLDDATWRDLNFDEIFKKTNRAITPIGAQYLYYLLRHPGFSESFLNKREKLIRLFSTNKVMRGKIQYLLLSLSEKNVKYLPYSIWQNLPEKPSYAYIFPFLTFLSATILILVLMGIINYMFVIGIFTLHIIIRFFAEKKIKEFILSFQYLTPLINKADAISKLKFSGLEEIQSKLKSSLKETRSIATNISTLQYKDELGLIEYVKIYLMVDLTGFYHTLNKIKDNIA